MTATALDVGGGVVSQDISFSHQRDIEEITCEAAGCSGCNTTHHRHTGRETVTVMGNGHIFTAELVPGTAKWEEQK